MNGFLKVLLLVLVAILAVKFLPEILALGFLLGVMVVALGAVGVSLVAALLFSAMVLAAVLSPVWVPLLIIVGLILLIKRGTRRTA